MCDTLAGEQESSDDSFRRGMASSSWWLRKNTRGVARTSKHDILSSSTLAGRFFHEQKWKVRPRNRRSCDNRDSDYTSSTRMPFSLSIVHSIPKLAPSYIARSNIVERPVPSLLIRCRTARSRSFPLVSEFCVLLDDTQRPGILHPPRILRFCDQHWQEPPSPPFSTLQHQD